MKPAAWVGLFIIASAIAFGAKSFVSNLTPYLTFAQAREAKGTVQVMGSLDKASIAEDSGALRFTIVSPEGDRMPVKFTSARPANFEMAVQVTAIGTYEGSEFKANNLLVKCPTKYQGTETKSYSADGGAKTASL